MTTSFCSGCMKQRPAEQMKRKKLRSGGVRLICAGCVERSRTRSDSALLKGKKSELHTDTH